MTTGESLIFRNFSLVAIARNKAITGNAAGTQNKDRNGTGS